MENQFEGLAEFKIKGKDGHFGYIKLKKFKLKNSYVTSITYKNHELEELLHLGEGEYRYSLPQPVNKHNRSALFYVVGISKDESLYLLGNNHYSEDKMFSKLSVLPVKSIKNIEVYGTIDTKFKAMNF